MIGPAFISAPDSASPHGSITPGNARPIISSACACTVQREHAGRQPLGADGDGRLEGPVLAGEPRQRAGLGESDLRRDCRRPSAALANSTEPKVPGGRNTTWPSARCGASTRAMSAWAVAGAGHTISSAPRTASPMSAVISAGRASCRPRKSLIVMSPPAARAPRSPRGRAATGAPRGRPAPDHRPPPTSHCHRPERRFSSAVCSVAGASALALTVPSAISSLSRKCCTLPMALRGRLSTSTYSRGTL